MSWTPQKKVLTIPLISATVIAAIRMASYYKENLSQEIAKILPFTLLAISVLNPSFFLETQYLGRVINQLIQIPSFFSNIAYYLIFIIILEIILRLFEFVFSLFKLEKAPKKVKKEIPEEEEVQETQDEEGESEYPIT